MNAPRVNLGRLRSARYYLILAFTVIFLALPIGGEYPMYIAVTMIAYMILASSWDLLYSYTGQLSLGHALAFGLGGLFAGLPLFEFGVSPVLSILVGVLAACGIQGAVGLTTIRLKPAYQGIAILLFAQAFYYISLNLYSGEGISPYRPGFIGTAGVVPFATMYYAGVLIFILLGSTVFLLERSDYAVRLLAIQSDPVAAEVLGIDVKLNKAVVWFLSSLFAGVAGAFLALANLHFDYNMFGLTNDFLPVSASIIGGVGTIVGPLVGGAIAGAVVTVLPVWYSFALTLLVWGVILLVMARFFPGGLVRFVDVTGRKKRPKPESGEATSPQRGDSGKTA